jgi:hypothetical protein
MSPLSFPFMHNPGPQGFFMPNRKVAQSLPKGLENRVYMQYEKKKDSFKSFIMPNKQNNNKRPLRAEETTAKELVDMFRNSMNSTKRQKR